MKQIILVRHGEAENNKHNLIGGWSDVKLTELGVRQADAVADRLCEELDGDYKIYSSDLARARDTAEIISEKLGKAPIFTMELREHNPGIASGMSRKEAEKHVLEELSDTIDWRPYPGAESWREFYCRVESFMEMLVDSEDRVLIVSHGGTIQNVIRWWMDVPVSHFFRFTFGVANTSVTVLETTEHGQKKIERLNDTSHYCGLNYSNSIAYS
jgi:broad specificity phosphatase PhoE